MDILKEEAEHGALNVPHLSKYILNMMTLLCAPVRDEAVQKLENVTDSIWLLRCETWSVGEEKLSGTLDDPPVLPVLAGSSLLDSWRTPFSLAY